MHQLASYRKRYAHDESHTLINQTLSKTSISPQLTFPPLILQYQSLMHIPKTRIQTRVNLMVNSSSQRP